MAIFDERATVIADAVDGTNAVVTPAGAVKVDGSAVTQPVSIAGVVDTNNSTGVLLGANGVFTGAATNVLDYTSVALLLRSNRPSAVNGVTIQFSNNGVDWIDASVFSYTPGVAPNEGQAYVCGVRGEFLRVVYTNGNQAQASFTLQTVLRQSPITAEVIIAGSVPGDDNYAVLTKSIISGHTSAGGGSYVDVKVNPSGSLLVDGSGSVQPISGVVTTIQGTTPWNENVAQWGGTPTSLGQKAMAASVPVVIANDQTPIPISGTVVATPLLTTTGTASNVAASVVNVTLLAANPLRLGAMIVNDSVHRLFVKCGATASATSYTKVLGAGEDWQVPFGYTGIIDGIWTTAAGAARMTEFT